MEIDYLALGANIRARRKALRWTQEKLAEKAEMEPSNVSHIERGATKVSLPTLVSIANALGMSMDELLYDSLRENRHISYRRIDELLEDCTGEELALLTEEIRRAKKLIRWHSTEE